jgi:hypothetical protein
LPDPNLVYGKVVSPKAIHPERSEGSVSGNTGAEGVLVYLRLISKEGSSSALLSDITDEKGSWSIEISNSRIRNLKKSFPFKAVVSESVIVDDGKGKRFKASTGIKEDRPWPTIILQAGEGGKK